MNIKIIKILSDLRPDCNFNQNVNFIENGLLDSLDIISLIAELESNFKICINSEDILPENFESIDAICKLISSK